MKKRNVGIQAAVAVLLGAASLSSFAGVAQGLTTSIAAQAIVSNTTAIGGGSIAYSTAAPLPLGNLIVKVTLGGGAKFLQAAGGAIAAGVLLPANTGAGTATVTAGTVSADQLSVTFPVAITVAAVPVNANFTFKPIDATAGNGGIINAAFLSTVGAVLPVTMSVGTSTVAPTDIDTPSTSNIVTSVDGLTYSALASNAATWVAGMNGAAIEAKKIEVATGSGIALNAGATSNTGGSTTLLNFGGFKFTNNAIAKAADGVTAFTLAANYAVTMGAVVTGNFSAAQGTGGKVFLTTDNACTVPVAANPNATVTATTATFTGSTAPATGVPTYVCMQINTPTNAIVIQPTTPSLVATIAGLSAATTTYTSAAATLFPLANNGGITLVKSYIPSTATGYTSYIRVINTGSVAAPVSAAVVNQTTGVAGTSAVIIANLAAGGSATLSSAQIEAAVGVIATGTDRPTLSVTAPSALKVQSFILTNANGNFAEVSGND